MGAEHVNDSVQEFAKSVADAWWERHGGSHNELVALIDCKMREGGWTQSTKRERGNILEEHENYRLGQASRLAIRLQETPNFGKSWVRVEPMPMQSNRQKTGATT